MCKGPRRLRHAPTLLETSSLEYHAEQINYQRQVLNDIRRREQEQRSRFALFLKILFKRLENAGDTQVQQQAKRAVFVCTRRKKMGDSSFSLVDTVEDQLRSIVGEEHWIRSHAYMRYYINRNQVRAMM